MKINIKLKFKNILSCNIINQNTLKNCSLNTIEYLEQAFLIFFHSLMIASFLVTPYK